MSLLGTGIARVIPNVYLQLFVANLGKRPKTLIVRKTVHIAVVQPTYIMAYPITKGEQLGVAVEKLYRK